MSFAASAVPAAAIMAPSLADGILPPNRPADPAAMASVPVAADDEADAELFELCDEFDRQFAVVESALARANAIDDAYEARSTAMLPESLRTRPGDEQLSLGVNAFSGVYSYSTAEHMKRVGFTSPDFDPFASPWHPTRAARLREIAEAGDTHRAACEALADELGTEAAERQLTDEAGKLDKIIGRVARTRAMTPEGVQRKASLVHRYSLSEFSSTDGMAVTGVTALPLVEAALSTIFDLITVLPAQHRAAPAAA